MNQTATSIALAAAAAAFFAMTAAPAQAAGMDAPVKCSGVNSCKGTSECKSAHNACKGQNTCKGMGWVTKGSAEECTKAGGTVLDAK